MLVIVRYFWDEAEMCVAQELWQIGQFVAVLSQCQILSERVLDGFCSGWLNGWFDCTLYYL